MRLRRSGAAAAAAFVVGMLAGVLPAGASAEVKAGSETASSGAVTATLTWGKGDYAVSRPHLTIVRGGVTAFDQDITDVCDGCMFLGADATSGTQDLKVVDLDGDGEPEVLVDAFTGGAHCCTVTGIYDFRPAAGTYGHLKRTFGNVEYAVQDADGDGRVELLSADDRFAYAFASYAGSLFPPLVLRYEHVGGVPHLRDVTRDFPAIVRKDARRALRLARSRHGEPAGALAAYVADEYLLGRGATGLREIAREARRGALGSRAAARAYRRHLLGALHAWGYR